MTYTNAFAASMFGFAVLIAATAQIALAQAPAQTPSEPQTLRVATRVLSPLVVERDGRLTGYSIDLWNEIANRIGVRTDFKVAPDVPALLETVRSGNADLGVAAISITAARAREFDFSQPILDAGLQIMVRGGGAPEALNILDGFARVFASSAMLVWLAIALLLVLIPAHVIWLLERRHPEGIISDRRYFPGIFDAMWWASSTLATQADRMPRSWFARVVAVLWMFASVVFIAYFTAQLTATLTVQRIQGSIAGPDDLPGKVVATTRGSTSEKFLEARNARVLPFDRIEDAYAALLDEKADAVVFDAPVLLHYAAHGGKGRVDMAGPAFRREYYGIVFPHGGPLREKVDDALLSLREDGSVQRLYDRWFVAD